MKKLRFLIFAIIITCCLAALAGCGLPRLSTPVDLKVDEATLTLSWRKITNARRYKISVNGDERDSRNNSYSLNNLPEGEYTLKVKAVGDDEETQDSKWSKSISFTREAEPGLTFTLKNKTEYEVSGLGTATGDVVIPETYRGKKVTSIGERAFNNKPKLTGVTLSENITKIGDYAFANCAQLTKINLPESLTEIGAYAFQSCRALAGEIKIPSKITTLKDNTFEYCASITKVQLHDNLTSIGKSVFSSCVNLTKIEIGNSVTTLGDWAFAGCNNAAELTLGRDLETIGSYAFANCYKLTQVTLAGSVKKIGNNAFDMCSELTKVTIGTSVREVGSSAFVNCTKLAEVTVGDNVQKIGAYAFSGTALWGNAENLVYAGNWLLGFKDNEAFVGTTLYERAFKDGVVGIASGAFRGLETITDISLPDSVTFINSYAFSGCTDLITISIGASVKSVDEYAFANSQKLANVYLGSYTNDSETHIRDTVIEVIGNYAFYKCSSLERITIPETVQEIGTYAFNETALYNNSTGAVYADKWLVGNNSKGGQVYLIREGTYGIANYSFYNATNLNYDIVIPESVKTIGKGAFYGSTSLIRLTLPAGLEEIKDYTFYGCSFLQLGEIPNTVTKIGRSAFYRCQMLGGMVMDDNGNTEFTIPNSVTEIGDYAFYGCGMRLEQDGEKYVLGINTLNIGNGVKTIGKNAFTGMVALETVNIGSGVTSFGERAFANCDLLTTVNFGASMESIPDRMFYNCPALSTVVIPSQIKNIGDYAFYKCADLEEIVISEGVESIGNYAFYGSSVKTIVLPKSLKRIGKQAFRNCLNLTSIILTDNITEIDEHAFYGCNDITFYTTLTEKPKGWSDKWNSAYRPVVWGVTLDGEGNVASFVKTATSVSNIQRAEIVPVREGFTFAGWATEQGGAVQYTAAQLTFVPDGTTLYAVWTQD